MNEPSLELQPIIGPAPAVLPSDPYLAERSPLRQLTQQATLDAPIEEVFPFFAEAENLQRITPDWMHFRIETPLPIEMRAGTIIDYRIRLAGVPTPWKTRIEAWDPPHRFVDAQLRGPYRCWWHEHRFEKLGERTRMSDVVLFTPALGRLGQLVAGPWVERQLRRVFSHRAQVIGRLFNSASDEAAA